MDRAIPYTAPYPALTGYRPGRNALIAMATDTRGQITGGQFIHLDRGSWCTYQQLYRLIWDRSVSSTNSRSFRFHFLSSGRMTRVMQQLIVV